jgi:ABC-type Co2+ transport system permease subunit
MQTLLLGHGGSDALGVNFAVQSIPAVLAGVAFRPLFRVMPALPSGLILADAFGVSLHLGLPDRKLRVFTAGALVGGGTVGLTVLLHTAVLYFGSVDPSGVVAWVSLVAHWPVIVVEAVGVGFACRVLVKAKPEWLGLSEGPHPPAPSPIGGGVFKSDVGPVPPPTGENLGGLNTPSPLGEGGGA